MGITREPPATVVQQYATATVESGTPFSMADAVGDDHLVLVFVGADAPAASVSGLGAQWQAVRGSPQSTIAGMYLSLWISTPVEPLGDDAITVTTVGGVPFGALVYEVSNASSPGFCISSTTGSFTLEPVLELGVEVAIAVILATEEMPTTSLPGLWFEQSATWQIWSVDDAYQNAYGVGAYQPAWAIAPEPVSFNPGGIGLAESVILWVALGQQADSVPDG